MVGLLGILKAGGAYLPLDPSHPSERLSYLLGDALASIVVADANTRGLLGDIDAAIVDVNDPGEMDKSESPLPDIVATDPAYLVYTSGSTGDPKGVMVTHGSLMAAFAAWEAAYGLRPSAHLQMAGVAFDVFAGDWSRALGSGGTLVLCPRDLLLDPEALAELIDREQIGFAEFVPAVVDGLVAHLERSPRSLQDLRLVAVGSDRWHAGLHERLRRVLLSSAHRELLRPDRGDDRQHVLRGSSLADAPADGRRADRPAVRRDEDVCARSRIPAAPDRGARRAVPGRARRRHRVLAAPGIDGGKAPCPGSVLDDSWAQRDSTGRVDPARWRSDGDALTRPGRGDEGSSRFAGIDRAPGGGRIRPPRGGIPTCGEAAVVVRGEADRRLAAFIVGWDGVDGRSGRSVRRWLKGRLPDYMVRLASIATIDRSCRCRRTGRSTAGRALPPSAIPKLAD